VIFSFFEKITRTPPQQGVKNKRDPNYVVIVLMKFLISELMLELKPTNEEIEETKFWRSSFFNPTVRAEKSMVVLIFLPIYE
jgi:hypothetical protein